MSGRRGRKESVIIKYRVYCPRPFAPRYFSAVFNSIDAISLSNRFACPRLNEIRRSFGLSVGGFNSEMLASLAFVEEKALIFERAGLVVVLSNHDEGEMGKACWKSKDGGGDWEEQLGYYGDDFNVEDGQDGKLCVNVGSLPMVLSH